MTDRFYWLVTTLGPATFFQHTRLILPTPRFFPTGLLGDEVRPSPMFDEIRAHLGVNHWPVRLVELGTTGRRRKGHAVAGSFHDGGAGPATITYHPRLKGRPGAFIGTLAHELSHYILAPHVETAPGGEAEHEELTDLAVIYAGFGLIDLEAGAGPRGPGYLSQPVRAYALATFLRLKGIDPAVTAPFLSRRPKAHLDRALRLRDARQDELVLLRGMDNR
ncbi:MAG: hypothetical protein AAF281_04010 [Pseudomonadota bacterium]